MNPIETSPTRRRRAPWVNLVVLALLAAALFTLMFLRGGRVGDAQRHRAVGLALPALELAPLSGSSTSVTLRDLRGKVAVVNFWATWCGPCHRELPDLAALA
ncbi:MAG: TlpA family protein disulfide reductase, partial [Pirellulaceae bacterium]|nr:TlpA family protein disulfide reductase [Pirellulaceae bacterium]